MNSYLFGYFHSCKPALKIVRGMAASLLFLIVLTAGCSVYTVKPPESPIETTDAFSLSGTGVMPDKWWTAFDDEALNSLVDEALASNMTLKSAWDRLDQAGAAVRIAGASKMPSVEGSVSGSMAATKNEAAGQVNSTNLGLGLAASYEVDLWGRIRSGVQAAATDMTAARQDIDAAAISISAEIATAWFQLIELRGELALLDEQVKTNTDYLDTITARFRKGLVQAVDVLQQKQTLEGVVGEHAKIRSSICVQEHRLAVLIGKTPTGYNAPESESLPKLPPLPKTGIPAEWLSARPDVQAAYLRIKAADYRVAVAIADRYPRLSLTARLETSGDNPGGLFSNWLTNLSANLLGPVFDAGRRKAEVARTRAVTSERLHAYGQTTLTAIAEVENALVQERRQAELIASLDSQLKLSGQSVEQLYLGYTKGSTDFTRFLTALLSHQRLQRTRLQAERDLVLYRVALYRSLGRGWELERNTAGNPASEEKPESTVNNDTLTENQQ